MTHIDTAELYGRGRVEETIVREVISGRRDEVFLVSKVMPPNADYEGTLKACEGSLRRCATDRLDVYLLHWPGPHPLEETIRAFEKLKKDGKIRAWGLSNFDVEGLEEAARLGGAKNIACNQVLYHLEERAIEHAVIPWCEKQGVAVVAYSPFGAGRFPSPASKGGKVLAEVAKARGATPYQVALRYLVRSESVFAIPKHSSVAHAEDNAGADRVKLTAADIEKISAAFPLGRQRGGVPTI
jgi:diketogulonate reductase-like aldo/keto reductase